MIMSFPPVLGIRYAVSPGDPPQEKLCNHLMCGKLVLGTGVCKKMISADSFDITQMLVDSPNTVKAKQEMTRTGES